MARTPTCLARVRPVASVAPGQLLQERLAGFFFAVMVRDTGQLRVAIKDVGFDGVVEAEGAVRARHLGVMGTEGGGDRSQLVGATRQRRDARVEGGHIGLEGSRGISLR